MKSFDQKYWNMFSKLLKKQFATATQKDLLSTKNMKKFLVGDFPAAL